MRTHSKVRKSLYEYAVGELTPEQQFLIENHLVACKKCTVDLQNIERVLRETKRGLSPADQRGEQFWNMVAANVRLKIRERDQQKRHVRPSVPAFFESFLVLRHNFAVRLAGACAVLALLAITWTLLKPEPTVLLLDGQVVVEQPLHQDTAPQQLNQYFRRSRTLLVGLSNMEPGHEQPIQLSFEQELSRKLVHEARLLKRKPIDRRSSELMGDLDKILVKLSNANPETPAQDLEIIRSGIHRENLLFKLRMAESEYSSPTVTAVKNSL